MLFILVVVIIIVVVIKLFTGYRVEKLFTTRYRMLNYYNIKIVEGKLRFEGKLRIFFYKVFLLFFFKNSNSTIISNEGEGIYILSPCIFTSPSTTTTTLK